MSTDGLPRLFSPEDVADALPNTSAWWVREQVRQGRIPCIRLGGRGVIAFTREHFDEIIRQREQRPFDEAPRTAPARVGKKISRSTAATGVPELRARKPRRARQGGGSDAA